MSSATSRPSAPLDPAERDAILASPLVVEMLSAPLLAELRPGITALRVPTGAALLRQGEQGDDLYLVVSGALSVTVRDERGASSEVDRVHAGGVVGEMALLTARPRTATVTALEPATVLRIPRAAFERIEAMDPAATHAFMRRVLQRLRRSQVTPLLASVFGTHDERALRAIEARLEWLRVPSGTRLFDAGDASEDLYIVVNGRLRMVTREASGQEIAGEEMGRGALVGAAALLCDDRRAAAVDAVREAHLLRLRRSDFDALVAEEPQPMMQLARRTLAQVRARTGRPPVAVPPTTLALVPLTPDVPLGAVARRLLPLLTESGSVLLLDSPTVDEILANPGVSRAAPATVAGEALTAWLSAQEREHAMLVLQGDASWSAWTERAVLQADRVVLVGIARSDPAPGSADAELARLGRARRAELVLLHADGTTRPSGTLAWLAPRHVAAHHHVRLGNDADIRRAARRLSGRAVGLVLGGGGARGFAHVGALEALDEAGITLDMIGGSSIGALVAACVAAGIGAAEMRGLAATFASPRKLLDRTLPIAALMVGAKVTALYRHLFADLAIEDLWVPFFAVSSGLSRAVPFVHHRGLLWRAVRASTAIPAIFPPLLGEDDEVHVDGGVMNNMPLDVMRRWCEAGTVIGINPMPTHDRLRAYRFGPSVSGWQALLGRLKLFRGGIRAPSILGSVMRATEINSAHRMREPAFRELADLLIEPPVGDYPILDFQRYREIMDIGYRATREKVTEWRAREVVRAASADDAPGRAAA